MSTLTTRRAEWTSTPDRPQGDHLVPRRSAAASSPVEHQGASGEATLDELLVGTWERLTGRAAVECLLCGVQMELAYAAHALPVGGRCRGCGTALS